MPAIAKPQLQFIVQLWGTEMRLQDGTGVYFMGFKGIRLATFNILKEHKGNFRWLLLNSLIMQCFGSQEFKVLLGYFLFLMDTTTFCHWDPVLGPASMDPFTSTTCPVGLEPMRISTKIHQHSRKSGNLKSLS